MGQVLGPNTAFGFGATALIAALGIALLIPEPLPFQVRIIAVITAIGGACLTRGISGSLEIKTKWVNAGGPLAVFVLVLFTVLGKMPELLP
jgi:choline-glycine betaine transporter